MLSPLSAGAILTGFRAALSNDHGAAHRVARALESFHGSGRAILTDSGTTALTLAMRWCLASTGRMKVALPAFCCYDLVTALHGAGAEVVFYDLDPATLGPDWSSLARAVAERPAAVVIVHLYGLPVDMPRILEMTEGTGITVIEDAAQGSGATLNRRPLGSFGPLAVLSFGRGKGVTGGHGGALLVNAGWRGGSDQSDLFAGARGTGEIVSLKAQWILARPSLYRLPASLPFLRLGDTVYRPPAPLGRMSAASAAVVERSWQERGGEISQRQRNADWLLDQGIDGVVTPMAGAVSGWLRLPVMARSGAQVAERSLGAW
ncbi:MAG TPA: DegT/DnrJ/EryC1/StrS family aminotransferase, partial [Gemmatimonadales bacterium]|nr:DegT/DnrJ/EryC1/StrS family aminotransferase [Gemmatimonadales bacterium]